MKVSFGYSVAKKIFVILGCCFFVASCAVMDERLSGAIGSGNLPKINMLIDEGVDIHTKDSDGYTALVVAIRGKRADVVKALLEAGADVHARNDDGSTALMVAAVFGHVVIVKILLDAGADINAKSDDGVTALMVAAVFEHAHMVQVLLEAGAHVNAQNKDEVPPLTAVAVKGSANMVKILLDAGADVHAKDKNGSTALMVAVIFGYANMVKVLLNSGADVDVKGIGGVTPLMLAGLMGHADIAKALLGAGVDVNAKSDGGFTALMIASVAKEEQDKVVKSISGAVPPNPILTLSVKVKPRDEVVKVLLDAGANVRLSDNKGKTALDYEKESGETALIKKYERKRNRDLEQKIMATCPKVKADSSLPPEVYADRKILEAKQESDEENYFVAAKIMEFVRCYSATNNISLPTEFYFEKAEILKVTGLDNAAKATITLYLKEVGRRGENYQKALQILGELE